MAEITVTATTGRPTGSRASGRLRAEGKVPAVVYGLGQEPVAVAVGWKELRHALVGEAGMNALIDLQIDDGRGELVMVKEMQRHPVRRDVLHVDFLRVSRDQEIHLEVPITLVGEATAVLNADGVVDQVLFHLAVTAKPQDIPNELTIDISDLELGGVKRVADLTLPAGVVAHHVDPEEPVVSGTASSPVEVEEVEEEEAAEGEAAEAAEAPAAEAPTAEAGSEGEAEGGAGE